MAFCTNCGTNVPDGIKFCTSCGTPMSVQAQPQAPPPPQQTYVQPQPAPQPLPQQAYAPPSQPAYAQPQPGYVAPAGDPNAPLPPGSKYEPITTGGYYRYLPVDASSVDQSHPTHYLALRRLPEGEQGELRPCDADHDDNRFGLVVADVLRRTDAVR